MTIAYVFIGLAAIIIFLRWGLRIGSSSPIYQPQPKNQQSNSGTSPTSTTTTAGATPTSPTPPTPVAAPVATPRSYSWQWWLVIITVVVLAWWGYKAQVSAPPRINAPGMDIREKLFISIDPLNFNKQKSRGVRVEMDRGFMTIIVKPGGRLVFDFNLSKEPIPNGFASIDYHLREILPQYVGYQINDVRHKEEYLFGSGLTRLGPELREFQEGKNEFTLFSKGELRINGDKQLVIYQR